MILYSSISTAYSTKTELAKLDTACESARQKALAPRKKERKKSIKNALLSLKKINQCANVRLMPTMEIE